MFASTCRFVYCRIYFTLHSQDPPTHPPTHTERHTHTHTHTRGKKRHTDSICVKAVRKRDPHPLLPIIKIAAATTTLVIINKSSTTTKLIKLTNSKSDICFTCILIIRLIKTVVMTCTKIIFFN